MSEVVTTKRTVVLRRVPPGDRWSPVDDPNTVLDSLTKGLEHVYQNISLTSKTSGVALVYYKFTSVGSELYKLVTKSPNEVYLTSIKSVLGEVFNVS